VSSRVQTLKKKNLTNVTEYKVTLMKAGCK